MFAAAQSEEGKRRVPTARRYSRVHLWSAVLGLVTLIAILAWVDGSLFELDVSVERMERLIESWGPLAALASIGLMVLHSFVPFPAEVLAVANGMLFGPIWGTVISWVGAMLGAWLAFGLARLLGQPFVQATISERHRTVLDGWSERRGGIALLVSRLIPVISFNLINYAAGLTRISWWTFTWATALGILPITIAMVLAGAGIVHLF